MTNTAIFIPARLASTRFPNKPLADIHGKPMIVHVIERAKEADCGDVFVASGDDEITQTVKDHGGYAIATNPKHPSGTDRIYEAITKVSNNYDHIINVQGDLPTIEPHLIRDAAKVLDNPQVDIATLVSPIVKEEEKNNPNIVKAVLSFYHDDTIGRALYFTRATAPYGEGLLYHHIGLYAYTKDALERFVSLPPTPLEQREKLEQLRALEHGMRIDAKVVNTIPLGVDTEDDLEHAKDILTNYRNVS